MKKNMSFILVILLALALISTGFTSGSTVVENADGFKPLTDQIWASYVSADPGHIVSVSTSGEAAYGLPTSADDDDYVGNYFNIEQQTYVSSGETKRHIDISSSESHGYLSESMSVIGMAKITDAFSMVNLPAGSAAEASWWDLF
jgi:hypothetical protein